ncbi:LysR substrate-binding domain-containing protein, partial [Klebsiella pneumoniae]
NLVARELGQVRYVACASPAFVRDRGLPDKPAELARLPVISAAVIGRPLRLSAYYGGQPRQHVVLEPTIISRNYAFLRDAMLAGLGIGVVPDYVV